MKYVGQIVAIAIVAFIAALLWQRAPHTGPIAQYPVYALSLVFAGFATIELVDLVVKTARQTYRKVRSK